MKNKYHAWAISYHNGFIVPYWHDSVPKCLEGCQKALFKTRKIARQELPFIKLAYKKAKVIKVWVAIESELRGDREERDRAVGALLLLAHRGVITQARCAELLGMSLFDIRDELKRVLEEE